MKKLIFIISILSIGYSGYLDSFKSLYQSYAVQIVGEWIIYDETESPRKAVLIWIFNNDNTMFFNNYSNKKEWVISGNKLILTYNKQYTEETFWSDPFNPDYVTKTKKKSQPYNFKFETYNKVCLWVDGSPQDVKDDCLFYMERKEE